MSAANTEVTAQAIADSSGVASATLQAPQTRRGLQVASIGLLVSPTPPIPLATVYRDQVQASNVLTSKTAGDRGSFIGTDDVLYAGQRYVVQWTGCVAGAVCTATLRGYPR